MNGKKRKSEEQVEAEKENAFLPVEITIDILSRLTVDSLIIHCMLVCKTWRSLIKDPAFVDVHTRRLIRVLHDDASSESYSDIDAEASVTTDFFLSSELIQRPIAYGGLGINVTKKFQIGKYINAEMGFKVSKPLNIKKHYDYEHWGIVGSSNGLICLYGFRDITVYNPCTNEHVYLPRPRFKTITDEQYNIDTMGKGFGYSPYTNEYKVVLICYYSLHSDEAKGGCIGEVSVYTLGTGKWRMKSINDLTARFFKPGVLMYRTIHWLKSWLPMFSDDDPSYEIVSFDLADEEFTRNTIQSPPRVSGELKKLKRLMVLGGCLCVTDINMDSQTTDVWVMNYKDKSWTMKFKIPAKRDKEKFLSPLAQLGKSKILVCSLPTDRLILYDLSRNESNDHLDQIIPYKIKSFVSLKALGEEHGYI